MNNIKTRTPITVFLAVIMAVTAFSIPALSGSDRVNAAVNTKANQYNNQVIPSQSPVAGKTLTLTIIGDNQGAAPAEGASKYVPYHWELERGDYDYDRDITYDGAPYSTVSVTPWAAGYYELEVDFMLYDYTNGAWRPNPNPYTKATLKQRINVGGTVKLSGNKGTVYGATSQIYSSGQQYGALPMAARSGYKFKGWYTKKFGGTKIKSYSRVTFSGTSRTLYAQWNRKTSVRFSANGGYVSRKSKGVTYSNRYGSLPTPRKAGYRFKGWYTKKYGGSRVKSSYYVKKSGRHTLYAHWTKGATTKSNGLIGSAKAKRIALKRTGGGRVVKCHLDYDDGRRVYEIEIIRGDYEYDLDVDARTGRIVEYDRDSVYDD